MADPITISAAASAPVIATAAEVGFFAGAIGFIAGFMLSWPALVILAILGVLFEYNEARGMAIFVTLVLAVTAFFFFNVSLVTLAMYAAGYIVVGAIWSFWRYKRHVDVVVEENKNRDKTYKERALAQIHPTEMLGTITAWIIVWPFSMVENLVGDILNFIQSLVTKFFRGIYMRIYGNAVSALRTEE